MKDLLLRAKEARKSFYVEGRSVPSERNPNHSAARNRTNRK